MMKIFTRDERGIPDDSFIVFELESNNIDLVIYLMQHVHGWDVKLEAKAVVTINGAVEILSKEIDIDTMRMVRMERPPGFSMEQSLEFIVSEYIVMLMDSLWIGILHSLPQNTIPRFVGVSWERQG